MISKINLQGTDSYKVTYSDGKETTIAIDTTGAVRDEVQEAIDGGMPIEPEFTPEQIEANSIAHFKALYLGVVNAKLKELDYDSLATVKVWEDDVTYGLQATNILNWYKSIIAYNYSLISSGTLPTDEEYLAGIPVYV